MTWKRSWVRVLPTGAASTCLYVLSLLGYIGHCLDLSSYWRLKSDLPHQGEKISCIRFTFSRIFDTSAMCKENTHERTKIISFLLLSSNCQNYIQIQHLKYLNLSTKPLIQIHVWPAQVSPAFGASICVEMKLQRIQINLLKLTVISYVPEVLLCCLTIYVGYHWLNIIGLMSILWKGSIS